MVDARSARFQGMVPGSWGTPAPTAAPARRTAMRQTEPPPPPPPPQRRTAMRQTEPPKPNFLDSATNVARDFQDSLLNVTIPFTAEGFRETGSFRPTDIVKDAGMAAAGGVIGRGIGAGIGAGLSRLPAGALSGRAGAGASSSAQDAAEAARARSINRYLNKPAEYYNENLQAPLMRRIFEETSERIPAGREIYRAPAFDEVLPTTVGSVWRPGRPFSTGGSQDLDLLGQVLRGRVQTGGKQDLNPRMIRVTTQNDVPGITNVNEYLSRMNVPNRYVSDFAEEGLLGPATEYILRNYTPGQGSQVPTWVFDAFFR